MPQSKKTSVYIVSDDNKLFENCKFIIGKLAYCEKVFICNNVSLENTVNIVTSNAKAYIPMSELIDRDKEIARLNKELLSIQKQFDLADSKLNNESFLKKAPSSVVEKVKIEHKELEEKIINIKEMIKSFSD